MEYYEERLEEISDTLLDLTDSVNKLTEAVKALQENFQTSGNLKTLKHDQAEREIK